MRVAPDGVIPIDDPAARIHRRAHLADHRGTVRLPAMLLLAHPLHANGPARQRARNQSRVGGCVIGAVVSVTPGPFHVDTAHLLDRHAQHLRNRLPVGVDALGVRPHRHCAVLELGNCAGGTDGRVRLIGSGVCRLHCLLRRCRRLALIEDRRVLRRKLHQHGRQVVLLRQMSIFFPARGCRQRSHRLHGLEFALAHHREEIAIADDLDHSRHSFHSCGIHGG